MSNIITIELCAEDRARIDRLTEALEKRQVWESRNCHACVEMALEVSRTNIGAELKEPTVDALQERLAETLDKAFKTLEEKGENKPTGAQETPPPTTTTQNEEKPTVEDVAPPPTAKKVERAELRAKVIELSANGLKEQVKEVIRAFGQTVPEIPEDKIAECYEKLIALEV